MRESIVNSWLIALDAAWLRIDRFRHETIANAVAQLLDAVPV
jgi:hypothetical protein